MPTYSKTELDAIRAKAEADRTPEEVKALAAADATKPEDQEHMIPKSRLDEVLEQNRLLKERMDKQEAEAKAARDKALAEQGNFQQLYEQSKARVAELEGLQGQVQTYEQSLKKTLESQLEALQPEMRKLVPKSMSVAQQLDWLAENRPILIKQQPFDIGTGRRGGGKPPAKPVEIDEATAQAAAAYGMSPEEYVKFSAAPTSQPFGLAVEDKSEGQEEQKT